MEWDGMGLDGFRLDGKGWDGFRLDLEGWDVMGLDAMGWDRMRLNGIGCDGMGLDRMGWYCTAQHCKAIIILRKHLEISLSFYSCLQPIMLIV